MNYDKDTPFEERRRLEAKVMEASDEMIAEMSNARRGGKE
jgi:hypothetical protein